MTLFFYNLGFVRGHLELHGVFKVLFSVLRAYVINVNEGGDDGFTKYEGEPEAYTDDEAFAEEDKAEEHDDILDGPEEGHGDKDDYVLDDDDDDD